MRIQIQELKPGNGSCREEITVIIIHSVRIIHADCLFHTVLQIVAVIDGDAAREVRPSMPLSRIAIALLNLQ